MIAKTSGAPETAKGPRVQPPLPALPAHQADLSETLR